MFNKVLEINPDHQEARSALNSCVTEMNNNYTRVKKIKHKVRVSDMSYYSLFQCAREYFREKVVAYAAILILIADGWFVALSAGIEPR